LWGTFHRNSHFYPDPGARVITGMVVVPAGLLVMTEASTFLVTENADGNGYRAAPISMSEGCVAPRSCQSLGDGRAIWLGRMGFVLFTDGQLSRPDNDEARDLRLLNKGRREQACSVIDPRTGAYMCWVPYGASRQNNLCFVYTGTGWQRQTLVSAMAVTAATDHTQHILAAGGEYADDVFPTSSGVWLLDHQSGDYAAMDDARRGVVETGWIQPAGSDEVKTGRAVRIWCRETTSGALDIEVMRDGRETVVETITVLLHPTHDVPPFWNDAVLGATGATWPRPRAYWTIADFYTPSASTVKLRMRPTAGQASQHWEFVGLTLELEPKVSGGARLPR
jgi:hypothetical protein